MLLQRFIDYELEAMLKWVERDSVAFEAAAAVLQDPVDQRKNEMKLQFNELSLCS